MRTLLAVLLTSGGVMTGAAIGAIYTTPLSFEVLDLLARRFLPHGVAPSIVVAPVILGVFAIIGFALVGTGSLIGGRIGYAGFQILACFDKEPEQSGESEEPVKKA